MAPNNSADEEAQVQFEFGAVRFLDVMPWEPTFKEIVLREVAATRYSITNDPSNTEVYKAFMNPTPGGINHRLAEAALLVIERGVVPQAFKQLDIHGGTIAGWTFCRGLWLNHLSVTQIPDTWGVFLLENPNLEAGPSVAEKTRGIKAKDSSDTTTTTPKRTFTCDSKLLPNFLPAVGPITVQQHLDITMNKAMLKWGVGLSGDQPGLFPFDSEEKMVELMHGLFGQRKPPEPPVKVETPRTPQQAPREVKDEPRATPADLALPTAVPKKKKRPKKKTNQPANASSSESTRKQPNKSPSLTAGGRAFLESLAEANTLALPLTTARDSPSSVKADAADGILAAVNAQNKALLKEIQNQHSQIRKMEQEVDKMRREIGYMRAERERIMITAGYLSSENYGDFADGAANSGPGL